MKHARLILPLFLLGTTAIIMPVADARAERADPCAIIEEEIVNLRPPEFDRPLRWRRTYGVEGEDKIISLVPLADQGFAAIGLTTPATKDPVKGTLTTATPQIYMNRHDRTGKLIWEKRLEIPNLIRVADAVVVKDRILIAADAGKDKTSNVHIISVDGLGAKVADDVVTAGSGALSARALVSDGGGDSVTLAATYTDVKKGSVTVSKLIRRSLKGSTLFDRVYLADIPSQFQSLQKLPDGTLLAVGRARIAGDRMGGWILHVDKKGDIITSQLFPRGRQSQINRIQVLNDKTWVTSGRVIASDMGANSAAWVMHVKTDATPIWQQYIRGGYNFDGRSIILLPDNRIQVLTDAQSIPGKDSAGRDHASVLTFTPEGRMSNVESFIEGANSDATDMIMHGEFRIVGGRAQTGYSNADKLSPAYNATYDVWLAGLPLPKNEPSNCGIAPVDTNALMDAE